MTLYFLELLKGRSSLRAGAARFLASLLWAALVALPGVAFLAPGAAAAEDEPLFRFQESAGPYSVGLQVIEQYDRSRTFRSTVDDLGQPYRGERARPLQTLIWYPARPSGDKTMTVQDYLSLWATEISFGQPKVTARAKEWSSGLGPSLAMPLRAVRDAPPVTGAGARFPVVIYAPGASNPSWENADLCEYLASHGYVVIAGPSLGARTLNMTIDVEGANTQAADISFLIGYAQTRSDTDMSRVAVAGMSWGGLANLFAAARDNRIGALIALDGSMRYSPTIVQDGGVHPDQLTIPLLAFEQAFFPLEDHERYVPVANREGSRNVLNAWTHGDLVAIHMMGLTHSGFTSVYQRNEDFWWQLTHVWPMWSGDYGRTDAMVGYAWVARYTLRFLDAYMKHDAQAQAFLKRTPAENGVPLHIMAVSYRAGLDQAPATFEAYRAEVGRQGFAHVSDIYAAFQAQDPKFALNEGAMMDWSDELIADNHLSEALALLKLNLQVHPDSNAAYVKLGSAYELTGEKQIAVKNYQEALARVPSDGGNPVEGDARLKLNELLSREDLARH